MRKIEDPHEQMPLKSQETAEPQKGQFISVNELPETDIWQQYVRIHYENLFRKIGIIIYQL